MKKQIYNLLKSNEAGRKLIAEINWKVDNKDFIEPNKGFSMENEKFKQINKDQMEQISKLVAFLDTLP
jgi:hypothetical protein